MANAIVPASMHILCIALRYLISQTSLRITKVSYLLRFFNKTRALVLSLGFHYFELRNIYNEFQEFQYSVVSLFIDSGVGLVLSTYIFCSVYSVIPAISQT